MNDSTLLEHYAEGGSEKAFAEIVNRYSNMVYSVCMRRLNDPGLAQDATQAVFFALSRKAGSISRKALISGWLFKAAIFAAGNISAGEERRKKHEKETERMREHEMTQEEQWEEVEPVLDNALLSLGTKERTAVILRYFQDKSHAEIGRALNISEHASQKRVERAVEKLRKFFARRRITLPAAVLAVLFSTRAVTAAPGIVSESCVSAVQGTVSQNVTHAANSVMRMIMWEKLKAAAAALICTAVIAAGAVAAINTFADARPASLGANVTLLDTQSLWHYRLCRGPDRVRTGSGELVFVDEFRPAEKKRVKNGRKRVNTLNSIPHGKQIPPPPPDRWREPDFDDSPWPAVRGPFLNMLPGSSLLCLRGKFRIADKSKVGPMSLKMACYGGTVVYLNNVEIGRKFLPEGSIEPDTAAEDYPIEAFADKNGAVLNPKSKKHIDRIKQRLRNISIIEVPESALRNGINILAVEVHSAPAIEVMYTKARRKQRWARLGVKYISLDIAGNAGVLPAEQKVKSFKVWNHTLVRRVSIQEYGDQGGDISPVCIYGARNGVFSGQIIAGSPKTVRNLKAVCSRLAGERHTIPSWCVALRYAAIAHGIRKNRAPYFEGLETSCPEEISVIGKGDAVIQPVWVSVSVPENAVPGTYTGTITVTAEKEKPVKVPVEMHVAEYVIPDPADFLTHTDLMQSPETLAIYYKTAMWSDAHWKLIERSFELMGQLGNRTVYIPMIRRTQLGNEHSMVRWVKKGNGGYDYDYSIAEKYLDLAIKHMGKPRVVCLYCWEFFTGSTFCRVERGPKSGSPIPFTVRDPGTGKLIEAEGPMWATPESPAFWKPVIDGMRGVLKKRGIAGAMMFGVSTDWQPTEDVVKDMAKAAPEVPWVLQMHAARTKLHSQPVGYLASVWGLAAYGDIPKYRHSSYGWRNPILTANFPRGKLFLRRQLAQHRLYPESCMSLRGKFERGSIKGKPTRENVPHGTPTGFGRVGADFWFVRKDRYGRSRGLVAGRYPESNFRHVNLGIKSTTPFILAPGKDGPIATTRFEMLRENLQELQARILIEDAFTVPELKTKIGQELAKRCFDLVEARTFAHMRLGELGTDWRWFLGSDWQKSSLELFDLAAKVDKALKQ